MPSFTAVAAAVLCIALLAGCAVCPDCQGDGTKAAVTGYCYRTLADVDCYTRPEPNRQPLAVLRQPVH